MRPPRIKTGGEEFLSAIGFRMRTVAARGCGSTLAAVAFCALGSFSALCAWSCGNDGATQSAEDDASFPDDAKVEGTEGGIRDGGANTDGALPEQDSAAPDAATIDGGPACPIGFSLLHDRRACPATGGLAPGSFVDSGATPGAVVSMGGLDEGNLPCVPVLVCRPTNAATMLFSDDPESPSSDGVLYADTVGPGRVRIYVYHANGDTKARKFPIVILNQNATDAHATIKKKGLATPSTDYVGVGKAVAAAWLDSDFDDDLLVPAQTRVLLDLALDAEHAAQNELVHAIYDVDLDAPMKISIVSLTTGVNAATATAGLSLLPDDTLHDRGTFPGADISVFASGPLDGARHLRFGNNVTEDDLAGTDATTGTKKTLGGNYGVFYTFQATAAPALALAVSPRGGDWGGVAQPSAGAASLLLPGASTSLALTTSAVWIGTYPSGTVTASIVTAGGSNLPIDLVVMQR
jgi:hypothetical protein